MDFVSISHLIVFGFVFFKFHVLLTISCISPNFCLYHHWDAIYVYVLMILLGTIVTICTDFAPTAREGRENSPLLKKS